MNARDAYLESRILTADPLELLRLLYRGAIEAVEEARQALLAGDIQRRTRNINRAIEITTELNLSLQRGTGNSLVSNLTELYDYMQRQLLEAHFRQTEPQLVEVTGLLKTLLEGWEKCQPEVAAAAATGYEQAAPSWVMDEDPSAEYAPLSCSY